MCLVCVEYLAGNLTTNEFLRNKREYQGVPHDEVAERVAEFALEMDMNNAKVTIVKD